MKWNSDTARSVSKGRRLMDRIICDICGSEFPETAEICPNCGFPRQGSEKLSAGTGAAAVGKVKGGRFSGKNIRKRQAQRDPDRGLWITIMLLIIAIILVSLYIVMRIWGGRSSILASAQPTRPTVTTVPVETTVPCAELTVNATLLELEEPGQQAVLVAKKLPENSTDPIVFTSLDPDVAQVSELGVITAVGQGQTTIVVSCGGITADCFVVCEFPEETAPPPETTAPPQPTEPEQSADPDVLKLDHEDVSLYHTGERFTIRAALGGIAIDRSDVSWSSSDPNVAAVDKGVVTAVGAGMAVITAHYQGQTALCIVRCQLQDNTWRASHTDVTIAVGESFRLSVSKYSGEKADVAWSMDREGIVSIDGGTVTGLAPGIVTLFVTVDDQNIWCIVRVK